MGVKICPKFNNLIQSLLNREINGKDYTYFQSDDFYRKLYRCINLSSKTWLFIKKFEGSDAILIFK